MFVTYIQENRFLMPEAASPSVLWDVRGTEVSLKRGSFLQRQGWSLVVV